MMPYPTHDRNRTSNSIARSEAQAPAQRSLNFCRRPITRLLLPCLIAAALPMNALAQVAVRGQVIYTMAGPPIRDGIVVIRDGKIALVGPAAGAAIPPGFRVLEAAVVTPGLVDAHSTVGLSGIFNQPHDQDQLERSVPIQPELRAVDAYNAREPLIDWLRGFGVTTLHTGHAPGELITGQTFVVKTTGDTVNEALLADAVAVAATLGPAALKSDKGQSPGTRAKQLAMLREQLIKSKEYLQKQATTDADQKPERDLKLESLGRVLRKEIPLMVTAHRAQDLAGVLRLAREFDINVWLDGAAECHLLLNEIKASGFPVIAHPPMMRAFGEMENASFETPARLREAGIRFALQSGYESYVPKTRVVLFEAAIAAANGLTFEAALASITIDAARILGVDNRVGSLEVGKDGDLALYDGDPFEYASHCVGTIINGKVVSETQN